jgi:hypothetical protein
LALPAGSGQPQVIDPKFARSPAAPVLKGDPGKRFSRSGEVMKRDGDDFPFSRFNFAASNKPSIVNGDLVQNGTVPVIEAGPELWQIS